MRKVFRRYPYKHCRLRSIHYHTPIQLEIDVGHRLIAVKGSCSIRALQAGVSGLNVAILTIGVVAFDS
jgi:hypothetical protein